MRKKISVVGAGNVGASAAAWLAEKGMIDKNRILGGLPHPSGANAERIAYFVGRKEKSALSIKTNGAALDASRLDLTRRLQLMPRH